MCMHSYLVGVEEYYPLFPYDTNVSSEGSRKNEPSLIAFDGLKSQRHFSFYSQLKFRLSGLEFTKKLTRIANREDPDITASSEAV